MFRAPDPVNEPNLTYAPGTPERAELRAALDELRASTLDVPCVVGGERIEAGATFSVVEPHAHARERARVARGGAAEVDRAVAAATAAHGAWASASWEERAAVFLRAADLLAGPWRAR